ncbi:hypothetical protein SDC9_153722 [bioreactor metagenome]|uniref:Uncharacterized protein n=1 Tax=bioreactor metagenome TaxID=1076179 RepID=A0A645EYG4_9ZZZZ
MLLRDFEVAQRRIADVCAKARRLLTAELAKQLLIRIHAADQVAAARVDLAFIMEHACAVQRFRRLAHGRKVRSRARLVAETPDHDAGVVAIPKHHAAHAIHAGIRPARVACG